VVNRSQRWLAKACQGIGKFTLMSLVGLGQSAVAQVVPDATLPIGERSQVSPGPLFQIDGGAVRDRNLFHSFGQFSLRQGETAFFNNAANITNIIGRVTGGQRSQIDGVVRANGNANLFFINPSGVLLGPNAALNIGGTFLVTTASAIGFGNQGTYSATIPNVPGLLTVDPSALLFNQIVTQAIVSQATLQVPAGRSLALVGGNILLNGGGLLAPGGQVELGGLVGTGTVTLKGGSNTLQLGFGTASPSLADVSLINGSAINVRSGGSITIQAQNLSLANRSILRGGIAAGGASVGKAGDITIAVPGALTLTDGSFIANSTTAGGIGDSGNVTIDAGSVLLKDGSQVNASTFGRGNSGTVTIRSPGAVVFDGEDGRGRSGGTYSQVNAGAVGNSGGINIVADSLLVTHGAVLSANTLGTGNAGSVSITTRGKVQFDSVGPVDQFPSGAYTGVGIPPFGNNPGQPGNGNSGGLTITAGSLSIGNGARLDASTSQQSQGNAGKIQIRSAGAITLDGDPSGNLADPGGIYTFIGDGAIGNSGGITLAARSLSLRNSAALVASTFGQGNAGAVDIRVAGPVLLDGQSPSHFSTGIFGSVTRIAKGNSGQIRLAVDSLTVINGAAIAASTLGIGKAAGVTIAATGDVSFDGVASDGFPGGIFSRTGANATGNSDITVTARSLSLTNGAQFQANTLGSARAGSIQITTDQNVRIAGKNTALGLASGLFSTTVANGNGGDVNVNARSLTLQDGATISAQSSGAGRAGNIAIRLRNRLQAQNSQILTTSTQSAGGNIAISARAIALQGNSDITTSVFSGAGGGGNIVLGAAVIVALDDSDILAFSRDGSGGNITLNTPAFFGFRYRPTLAYTDPAALDGNGRVDVNASGRLRSGVVTLPDVTLIPNNLAQLPSEVIDTSRLIANSCIAHTYRQGRFLVTGAGGLPNAPDDLATAPFPTYAVMPIASGQDTTGQDTTGLKGNAPPDHRNLVEIDGIYRLASGEVILGRSCAGL